MSVRGDAIRNLILNNMEDHPYDIVKFVAKGAEITSQAVHKHIKILVDEGLIIREGTSRKSKYSLVSTDTIKYFPLDNLKEDVVWREEIQHRLGHLPKNVLGIWNYAFTEMLNNAIDHSSGDKVSIIVVENASYTRITIWDDGEGIFSKIQRELGLDDERHSLLELSKGKLTTDPENHSGEGIFFSSRMFDSFGIGSGNVRYSHARKAEEHYDVLWEDVEEDMMGTMVIMTLKNRSTRTAKEIFDEFSSDFAFTKTIVPVHLVQYGDEMLVSRSQAKRLLTRIDRFDQVIFDFNGVESIGQGFTDEIFRVFANAHSEIEIFNINANEDVERMIKRVKNNK